MSTPGDLKPLKCTQTFIVVKNLHFHIIFYHCYYYYTLFYCKSSHIQELTEGNDNFILTDI